MIARSRAVIEAGGVLRTLSAQPPLTLRRVRHDDPQVCALCLVNTAAGPLAGDVLDLELEVGDGARAVLTAAGAAIAQGRGGAVRAVQRTEVRVGEHAYLDAVSAPLIAARGSAVDLSVAIRLAATASVRWRELLVLGRTDEPPGELTMSWNVERAGAPVLRQFIDLGDPALRTWPGLLADRRVLATCLVSAPGLSAVTLAGDPTAVVQAVDTHTMLATVLDDSAAAAGRRMSALLAAADPDSGSFRSLSEHDGPESGGDLSMEGIC